MNEEQTEVQWLRKKIDDAQLKERVTMEGYNRQLETTDRVRAELIQSGKDKTTLLLVGIVIGLVIGLVLGMKVFTG